MRSLLAVLGFFSLSVFVSPVSAQDISPAEQGGIKATCSWEWTAYGPADYYQCLDSKAKELRGTSQPNISGISSSDLEGIKSTCSWKWTEYGPADYYQCLDSKAKELRGTIQSGVTGLDDKALTEPRTSKEQSGFISSIQGVMGILRYYEGKPNGIYDQQTLYAVRTYQKDRGLSPDDTIGEATRNQLVKDITRALNGNRPPPSPTPIQVGGSGSELSAMKRSRFSEEQIVGVLKEAEAGVPVKDLCRRMGISDATFYHWKAKYGGLEVNEGRRLRQLEEENGRLKKVVAQQALDLDALKVVLAKKW